MYDPSVVSSLNATEANVDMPYSGPRARPHSRGPSAVSFDRFFFTPLGAVLDGDTAYVVFASSPSLLMGCLVGQLVECNSTYDFDRARQALLVAGVGGNDRWVT